MKKGAGRENRVKTIIEWLKQVESVALENEEIASKARNYGAADTHMLYATAIERVIEMCGEFLVFKEEKKETGG